MSFNEDRAKLEAILEDTNTPAYTDKELEMMKMFARNSESPIPMEPLILKALLDRLDASEKLNQAWSDLEKGNVSYDNVFGLKQDWLRKAGKL